MAITDTDRACKVCNECKPIEDFLYGKNSRRTCKVCWAEQRRADYSPEKERAKQLRNKYGLTVDEYDERLMNQNGVCAICQNPPDGGRWPRLAVDHDHERKVVRGLLCEHCNIGLGKFKDDPVRLGAAIQYLATNSS